MPAATLLIYRVSQKTRPLSFTVYTFKATEPIYVIFGTSQHWLRFFVRQTSLARSAPVLCRSDTTSERSTLRSFIPDGTIRTARIFVGGYSWTE